ncbi:hypothetical protein LK12_12670 [Novosphingobium malaysiense]|uniref:Uncharacterized protein n=1 Tax=Novosphingobium malaysiense TaxID=1348853 RepID=A0A0B1ZLM3_9SPHN|nr:hypothetical protein LK12_12670 [Novosphingobium malaysiense]
MAGPQAEFLTHAERPWTSATFEGTRHIVILAFRGRDAMERGEAFGSALPDHEFDIPGHLVADAAIASIERENGPSPQMRVEADFLLLRDC